MRQCESGNLRIVSKVGHHLILATLTYCPAYAFTVGGSTSLGPDAAESTLSNAMALKLEGMLQALDLSLRMLPLLLALLLVLSQEGIPDKMAVAFQLVVLSLVNG